MMPTQLGLFHNVLLVSWISRTDWSRNSIFDRINDYCTQFYDKTGHVLSSKRCPFAWESGPYGIYGSLDPPESKSQTASRSVQPFCTDHCRASLYVEMDRPAPQNCLLPWEYLDSYVIHDSLGPHESSTQTASRSVQPFMQCYYYDRQTGRQTDRSTDHATRAVAVGRTYVRSTVIRPNNSNKLI